MSPRTRAVLVIAALAASGALLAMSAQPPSDPISAPQIKAELPPLPPAATKRRTPTTFDRQIMDAARAYTAFHRVSEAPNWGPTACFAEGIQASVSEAFAAHGRKLYYLYARDAAAYYRLGGEKGQPPPALSGPSPVGQVVVKESFHPVEVGALESPELVGPPASLAWVQPRKRAPSYDNSAHLTEMNGKLYQPGSPAGLFIMLKLDPATPDTDEGWVYATTTADGTAVLEAGRIDSCIDCHSETTRDRLYGPRWTWPKDAAGRPTPPLRPATPDSAR